MKKYEYTLYRTKSLAKCGECPAGVQVMASPWLWGRYCYCKLVEGGKVRSSKVGCVPDTLDGIVHIVHSRNCRQEEAALRQIFTRSTDSVLLLLAALDRWCAACIWMHQLPPWEFGGLPLLCSFHHCVISNIHKPDVQSKMKKTFCIIHCSPTCGDM